MSIFFSCYLPGCLSFCVYLCLSPGMPNHQTFCLVNLIVSLLVFLVKVSICMPIFFSIIVCLPVCLYCLCLPFCASVCLSLCLSYMYSICLTVFLSLWFFVYLSICLWCLYDFCFGYLSVCLIACLFVCDACLHVTLSVLSANLPMYVYLIIRLLINMALPGCPFIWKTGCYKGHLTIPTNNSRPSTFMLIMLQTSISN